MSTTLRLRGSEPTAWVPKRRGCECGGSCGKCTANGGAGVMEQAIAPVRRRTAGASGAGLSAPNAAALASQAAASSRRLLPNLALVEPAVSWMRDPGSATEPGWPAFDGGRVDEVFYACLGDEFLAAGPVPRPPEPFLRVQWRHFLGDRPTIFLGWTWSPTYYWVATGDAEGSIFRLSIVSPTQNHPGPFTSANDCSFCSYDLHTQIVLRRREDSSYFAGRSGLVQLQFDLLLRRASVGRVRSGANKNACQMVDVAEGLVYLYLSTAGSGAWVGQTGFLLNAARDASIREREEFEVHSEESFQSCEELLTRAPTAIAMQTWIQLFFGSYLHFGDYLDRFFLAAENAASAGAFGSAAEVQSATAWQLCGRAVADWQSRKVGSECDRLFENGFRPSGVAEPNTPSDSSGA